MNLRLVSLAALVLAAAVPASARAGIYSGFSGVTPGAIDNPIARSQFTKFESSVASYDPAPGVGPNFGHYETGFAPLGDLYSPVTRPTTNTPFNRYYAPAVGSEPSPFHAGTAVNDPFSGDLHSTTDTYGFIGIDRPGSITLGFDVLITNGQGADFAVFENGFQYGGPTSLFAELAYVEVSSNGTDFARFDSISLNTASTSEIGTFQGYDVTNIYNLAGKHATNWGTPFDLDQLSSHVLVALGLLDLTAIRFVRLVDVVGSGNLYNGDGSLVPGIARDSLGNAILDNFVTFDSGGFDYLGLATGAIGVRNFRLPPTVPEPSTLVLAAIGGGASALAALRRRRRHATTAG